MATCLTTLIFAFVGASVGGILGYSLGWLLMPLLKDQDMSALALPLLTGAVAALIGGFTAALWLWRR